MRPFVSFVSVVVIALIGLAVLGERPSVGAQEATPVTEMVFENVTVEPLAAGSLQTVPPLPADISLVRARFAPGGRVLVPANDPGTALFSIEAGTLTVRSTAPVMVTRGAGMATPGAQAQEQVAANAEFTLGSGDSFVGPPMSGGEFRNDGAEEAILLVVSIAPRMGGTPTP